MPNNEIITGRKSIGNFTIEYQRNGCGAIIPVIDGTPQPNLMFGYVSETDLAAGMRLIENALRATGNNIHDVQRYIMQAMQTAAHDIHPDECVDVNGNEILISYAEKTAHLGTEEIANLADMTCELPNEAIKALLVSRTETALAERAARHEIDYDEWEDYDDDEEFDYI